jgi:hypothetical protein
MTAATDRMSTLDAEFFYAEHDNMPMHIGSVAVFDGPAPTREDLMRLFEAKLPRVPRYRQVVRIAPRIWTSSWRGSGAAWPSSADGRPAWPDRRTTVRSA